MRVHLKHVKIGRRSQRRAFFNSSMEVRCYGDRISVSALGQKQSREENVDKLDVRSLLLTT